MGDGGPRGITTTETRTVRALSRTLSSLSTTNSRDGPSQGTLKARARKDRRDRLRALKSIVEFERVSRDDIRWTATLGTARVQALWGTFSDVVTLRPVRRVWFLSELGRIVDDQFDGKVDIPVLTPVYTARRR